MDQRKLTENQSTLVDMAKVWIVPLNDNNSSNANQSIQTGKNDISGQIRFTTR